MADTNWPIQLENIAPRLGWQRRPQQAVVRSDTDHGPRETRLEYTAVAVNYTVTYRYNDAQAKQFWDWYKDIVNGCAYGARTFTWTEPLEDVLNGSTGRFLSEPISINFGISGDGTGSSAGPLHDIRCEIELLVS